MPPNRRNYYRLLHVQADAPPDVVKAAYRALIRVHHPDAGGDHQVAALLNEAYAVLSDESRRSAYDVKRATRPARAGEPSARRTNAHSASAVPHGCAFCHFALPLDVCADTRCLRCLAPLSPARHETTAAQSAERRGLPRVTKSDWGTMRSSWPGDPLDVRMRDLSLDGISIYCGSPLAVGTTVRVVAEAADVVADVVSCRRVAKVFTLHARLITAIYKSTTGGFVSTMA